MLARSEESLNTLQREMPANSTVISIPADIANSGSVNATFETIRAEMRISGRHRAAECSARG
jgi:short-subunit dehydrogenase